MSIAKQKAKQITYKGKELNKQIIDTLEKLSNIVGSTLGPGGNAVLIERIGMAPMATKDGVTVADSIAFKDATQHVISEAAKEACQRTNKEAGDGTTTAIILAHALVKEGIQYLDEHKSKSPQELCRELEKITKQIADNLKQKARQITREDLHHVAMVSSNFDEEISNAVIQAIELVGEDGTIITDESGGRETIVESQDGFPVSKGLSQFGAIQEIFINNPQDQECQYDNPYILLYDGDLLNPPDIGIFLMETMQTMKQQNIDIPPIVLIAHKFSPNVLKMLAQNVQLNTAVICPLETSATAQPNSKHHLLHDIAAFTDGEVLDPITNTFSKIKQNHQHLQAFGKCGKSKIGRYKSVFLDSTNAARIEERIEILKNQMKNAESDYDRELIKERIGQLSGGIATIYIGGSSDLEIREKKHRIEDTINATRSAIEMGIVAGGGVSLLLEGQKIYTEWAQNTKVNKFNKLCKYIPFGNQLIKKNLLTDLPSSAIIISRALNVPFYRIMQNVGYNKEVIYKIMETVFIANGTTIYDALKHKFINPFEGGIIDPVKVTISALYNAMSIAKELITLGGAVVVPRDIIEERQAELQEQALSQTMQQS